MAKESAEQKLLKILEAKKGTATKAASVQKAKKAFKGKTLTIKNLNKILILGILVGLAILGLQISSGFSLLERHLTFNVDSKNSNSPVSLFSPETKSLSYYLDQINARNIFRPYEGKVTEGPAGLSKKFSKFKLVGIAWLDLPETATVMIENTETKETLFLQKGEKLEDVTVKTIYTDRAVFSYENEEITIKL